MELGGDERRGGEAFSPSLIRAVGGTCLGPFAMHGPQGAGLHAPRVAPARILAAELLAHVQSCTCFLARILHQLRVLMISTRARISHGQWKEEER